MEIESEEQEEHNKQITLRSIGGMKRPRVWRNIERNGTILPKKTCPLADVHVILSLNN